MWPKGSEAGGRSLRSSFLWASGLLTLLLILLIFLVTLPTFFQGFLRSTEAAHAAVADEGAYLMGLFLDSSVEDLLRAGRVYAAARAVSPEAADAVARAVQEGLVKDGRFRSVRFVDPSGTVIAAYPDSGIVGFSLRGSPELGAREDAPYRGTIKLGLSGELSIPVSVLRGGIHLVGDLDLDWLRSLVDSLSAERSGTAAVLDRDGTIVAHRDASLVDQRVNVSNHPLAAGARERGAAAGVYSIGDGASRVGAARRIEGWHWVLLFSRELGDVYASVVGMAAGLAAGFILCGGLFFLVILKITRRMLTPLSVLVEGARGMAAGDYGALAAVPRSYAEIDALAREFDTMARGVADREERLERTVREKDLLLREVHHRVKNNMQIISSLIALQRSSIGDAAVAALFEEAERRVQSMAMIHERLYLSDDMSSIDILEFLKELAANVAQGGGESCAAEGDSVHLGLDQAVPCALAVNELVMNADKHGCRNNSCTSIDIAVKLDGAYVEISVSDDGPGLPDSFDPRSSGGLGMSILSALAEQLSGGLRWGTSASGGAVFILRFPFLDPASRGVVH